MEVGAAEAGLSHDTYRYTVTTDQNDSCIKMGSGKRHFNGGRSHKTVSTLTETTEQPFGRERYRTEAWSFISAGLKGRAAVVSEDP